MNCIEDRIKRLERSNRRLRNSLVAMIAIGGIAIGMGMASADKPSRQEILLTSTKAKPLFIQLVGSGGRVLNDARGQLKVTVDN